MLDHDTATVLDLARSARTLTARDVKHDPAADIKYLASTLKAYFLEESDALCDRIMGRTALAHLVSDYLEDVYADASLWLNTANDLLKHLTQLADIRAAKGL